MDRRKCFHERSRHAVVARRGLKQHGRVYPRDPPVLFGPWRSKGPFMTRGVPAPSYPAVTAIFRGVALATLGRVTVRTPSASLASILAWSMTSERVNWRK